MLKKSNKALLLLLFFCTLLLFVGCDFAPLEPTSYTLTIQAEGLGIVDPEIGDHQYESGAVVQLLAQALEGWEFQEWVGEVNKRESSSATVVMDNDKTVKAIFVKTDRAKFTLTIEQKGRGEVSPNVGQHLFKEGEIVEIEAAPEEGWIFESWIGEVANPEAKRTTVIVDQDKSIAAIFAVADDHDIVFADAHLEKVVREVINKHEGPLSLSDVIELEALDASGREIVSLDGIENLRYLTSLRLDYNSNDSDDREDWTYNFIEDLSPLSQLTELEYLFLSSNQVSDLAPIKDLRSLKRLTLNSNQISDLSPLENLTNLSWLTFLFNEVENIEPLKGLTKLSWLIMSNNQISDLRPIESMTKLEVLWISNNQITDLAPLSDLTQLTWIMCHDNQIVDLAPLKNLSLLSSLWLFNNQISDLSPLQTLTKLKQLPFDNNQVSELSPLEDLIDLYWVRFTENQVSDISPLVKNCGFGPGDTIDMRRNLLDLTPGSQNMEDIETLLQRGVEVFYDPQTDQKDYAIYFQTKEREEERYMEKMLEYLYKEYSF